MILLLSFAFLLVIAAFFMSTTAPQPLDRQGQYADLAQQMVYYHVAAARVCQTSCTGVIDPTPQLASFRRNQGPLTANTVFRSLGQNGHVITYYANPNGGDDLVRANAGILAALIDINDRDTLSWIGSYNQSTGTLNPRARSYWVDPETGEITQTTVPALPITALAAPNGAPVLVNRQ